jgi:hypothetical protein
MLLGAAIFHLYHLYIAIVATGHGRYYAQLISFFLVFAIPVLTTLIMSPSCI